MVFAKPHYLLFCDASVPKSSPSADCPPGGRWHFVLERIDAQERLEAADGERATPRDRLSLLAVVRGLEALEQPSQVTLVTTSRYVARGLRYGLSEWRETGYIWEHFGVQKPIRNADLWQRIDCALQYHEVACRLLESSLAQPEVSVAEEVTNQSELELLGDEAEGIQPEVVRPMIPAPHYPVRSRRPESAPRPRLRIAAGLAAIDPEQAIEDSDADRSEADDATWQTAAFNTTEVTGNQECLPEQAAAGRRLDQSLRPAAGVRSKPRPQAAGVDASWWQTAAGWLGWAQGRSAKAGHLAGYSGGHWG